MIPAQSKQDWHRYDKIEEDIFILSGWLTIEVFVEDKIGAFLVAEGDLIRVQKLIHRLVNTTDSPVIFLVFRFVPGGIDKRKVIKSDKISCLDVDELLNYKN